jgi:hypothetical protein
MFEVSIHIESENQSLVNINFDDDSHDSVPPTEIRTLMVLLKHDQDQNISLQ